MKVFCVLLRLAVQNARMRRPRSCHLSVWGVVIWWFFTTFVSNIVGTQSCWLRLCLCVFWVAKGLVCLYCFVEASLMW